MGLCARSAASTAREPSGSVSRRQDEPRMPSPWPPPAMSKRGLSNSLRENRPSSTPRPPPGQRNVNSDSSDRGTTLPGPGRSADFRASTKTAQGQGHRPTGWNRGWCMCSSGLQVLAEGQLTAPSTQKSAPSMCGVWQPWSGWWVTDHPNRGADRPQWKFPQEKPHLGKSQKAFLRPQNVTN